MMNYVALIGLLGLTFVLGDLFDRDKKKDIHPGLIVLHGVLWGACLWHVMEGLRA